jgi:glutamine---fructose-6-phosphate transaminase (isomerizing)
MTNLLRDILRQPGTLTSALQHHAGTRFAEFIPAEAAFRSSPRAVIVAIGASFNAGLGLAHTLRSLGQFPQVVDASEFDAIATLPRDACYIFLSRSGKSIELVEAADRCAREGLTSTAFTNDPSSPLARRATHHVALHVPFDHAVSIVTYTALILIGGLCAMRAFRPDSVDALVQQLERTLAETGRLIPGWQATVAAAGPDFLGRPTYFLARDESVASAQAAMLLWQEVIKLPAVAMTTGTFRHGPQEVLRQPINVFIWLSPENHYSHDRQLVEDLTRVGARTIIFAPGTADLGGATWLSVPDCPKAFRAVVDVIPIQLWSERLATAAGIDCDRFLYCNYIVEKQGGL